MLPATQRQPAYVLHRRPYRESSVIVELLTRDHGRVGGVARGVKRGRGGAHAVEPFAQVAVCWRGRGELVSVLRCEAQKSARLRGDALFAGLYVNELLVKTLSREEPAAELFEHYGDALRRLGAETELEPILRAFERRLLIELGYGLTFDRDVRSGAPIAAEKTYGVVVGEGFQEVGEGFQEAGKGTQERVSAPRAVRNGAAASQLLTGGQIAAMNAGDYRDAAVRRVAKRIFRSALEVRLGGRRLTARSLFRARSAQPDWLNGAAPRVAPMGRDARRRGGR